MAKKGGGGPSNQVGEAYITVGIDNSGVAPVLKQTEDQTRQSAAKINESLGGIGRGGTFDNLGKGIKDSTAGMRNLLSAVVGVVGAFTRMVGLVGLVVGSVTALAVGAKKVWDYFTGAADEAARMEKNLENAAAAYERYVERINNAAKNIGSPTPNIGTAQDAALDQQIARQATYIRFNQEAGSMSDAQLQKEIDKLAELEAKRKQILDARARAAEIERQAEAKKEADAKNAELLREEKALRKLEEDRHAERMKREQEIRDYQEETEKIIRQRQKELNEARAKAQREERAEREKMAREYAKELRDAISGAMAETRVQSDAMMERMATSIGRMKEIAESQRQAANRGDTSTAGGQW